MKRLFLPTAYCIAANVGHDGSQHHHGGALVTTMRTIDFPSDQLADFRSAMPVGVEHYVIAGAGRTYVNIRTTDDQLLEQIRAALRPLPVPC
jgi:hypothetical protein